MTTSYLKRNERDWATQLVSWIQVAIESKSTSFEYVTAETGVKLDSGRTKFPDILLFSDRVAGVIFNGWELKFPDTAVDDKVMLLNALEKAQRLHSDSFVTWNGAEAIIWKIDMASYSIDSLVRLKYYSVEPGILTRDDLADPSKYNIHEARLKARALEILHDLEQLKDNGSIKPAINITGNIIDAVRRCADFVIPQFKKAIDEEKGANAAFRQDFKEWTRYEGATLAILKSSSRRTESVVPEEVLGKFAFYNLIGKIIFYLTLRENLPGELPALELKGIQNIKMQLEAFFEKAKAIDYQAIFQPYFTDCLPYTPTTESALFSLIGILTEYDFKILPTSVIGNILENLVPKEEKQKFGQYFTPETLANLVAFPVVRTNADVLMDPTSGTGTFLNSFYKILQYHGLRNHSDILNHIWGNDISHFPAILSVINLYKQDVTQTDNFPRIIRDDFFNLNVGRKVDFPNPHNHKEKEHLSIPTFDGIASNFPFIQQEDIPNDVLTAFFRSEFQTAQQAFLRDDSFKINERSDYFTYCVYNSIRFLKEDGMLSAVTSNAWLGKEYGVQFKRFLLDNFHIKYVVRSNAEHWFTDSQVSTVYLVLERGHLEDATRFVTINFKFKEYFSQQSITEQLSQIEDFYYDIDHCSDKNGRLWHQDNIFTDLFHNVSLHTSVAVISKDALRRSLQTKDNWSQFFISANIFGSFSDRLSMLYPKYVDTFRGERTGWNPMFILDDSEISAYGIEKQYFEPYVKGPGELKTIKFQDRFKKKLFVCSDRPEEVLPGARVWISKFEHALNKNGTQTISEACSGHKPYWYSLRPKQAQIVTAINPYDRLFFAYSDTPFTFDQRLAGITVKSGYNATLIAALLNSAITILTIELKGTNRSLGALDLNADYLKNLPVLMPDLLDEVQQQEIIRAFSPLTHRKIGSIFDELQMEDRKNFDLTVFVCYGISTPLLDTVYGLIRELVDNRVSMTDRT